MASKTGYLELTKPSGSDLVDIDVLNGNADILDGKAKSTDARLSALEKGGIEVIDTWQ